MKLKAQTIGKGLAFGLFLGIGIVWAEQVNLKNQFTQINGTVEWRRGETDTWKLVSDNQTLERGDQVRTGDPGEAVLNLEDGTVIQLSSGTEFTVSAMAKDPATEQIESVVALLKGRVRAQVHPLKPGSTFEIETPAMVASVRGTTLNVGINADGSINAGSEEGNVQLIREGENNFIAKLESGEEALIEYDPNTGTIKITCLKGILEITGPDGSEHTLNPGDTVTFEGGAATFIPADLPPAPGDLGSLPEQTDNTSGDTPASSTLSSPPSGAGPEG